MFIGSSRYKLLGCPLTLCFLNLAGFAMPGNAIQHTIYLGLVSEIGAGQVYPGSCQSLMQGIYILYHWKIMLVRYLNITPNHGMNGSTRVIFKLGEETTLS